MRVKTFNRSLLSVALLSLSLLALPAAAADTGTQVQVTMPSGKGELPDAEKLVQALEAPGGEHQVEVKARKSPEQVLLTVKLWGNTVPAADIPRTLRDAFPVLAGADIQVSALDASERPQISVDELRDGGAGGKRVKIIKKETREQEQKQ